MKQAELFNLLKTSGIPFAYYQWDETDGTGEADGPPPLPYGVFLSTGSHNFGADGKVYAKATRYQVELYTAIKDPETEESLENVLDGAGIFYDKTETYIDSEKMFQILYEIEV